MERDFPQGIDAEDLCTSADLLTGTENPAQSDKQVFESRSVCAPEQFVGVPAISAGTPQAAAGCQPRSGPGALFARNIPERHASGLQLRQGCRLCQIGTALEQLLWTGYLQNLAWFLAPYDTGMMLVHKITNSDPSLTETWLYIFPRKARQNYLTVDIPNKCTYIQCNQDGEIETVG
jgi:hypothetical protein